MKKSTMVLGMVIMGLCITSGYANVGPYVGLDAGIGGADNSNLKTDGVLPYPGSINSAATQEGGLTVGAHIGYTIIQRGGFEFGFEGGYHANPKNTLARTAEGENPITEKLAYSSSYTDLLAVAQLHLSPRWGVVAKYGTAHVRQSTSFDDGDHTFANDRFLAGSNHGNLPEVAVGVTYQMNVDDKLSVLAKAVTSDNEPVVFPSSSATREGINRLASSGEVGVSYERIF